MIILFLTLTRVTENNVTTHSAEVRADFLKKYTLYTIDPITQCFLTPRSRSK